MKHPRSACGTAPSSPLEGAHPAARQSRFRGGNEAPPKRLRRLPLEGAHPAARQSRFRGCPRTDFAVLVLDSLRRVTRCVVESTPTRCALSVRWQHVTGLRHDGRMQRSGLRLSARPNSFSPRYRVTRDA